MQNYFLSNNCTIYLWRIVLSDLMLLEDQLITVLSSEEIERANRFHFSQHRQRFIITRGILREILSLYINVAPRAIVFSYEPHGKPFLENNYHNLEFNISHSADMAILAFTKNNPVGVDIEKIENYNDAVAQRFFTAKEYADLNKLSETERIRAFYVLWACKEALLKTIGSGLYASSKQFSISLDQAYQSVLLADNKQKYHLEILDTHVDYASAFATKYPIKQKISCQWLSQGPTKDELLPS